MDEDLAGVRVVDYKTGAVRDVAGVGVFNGGRRLQHGLYALAIEARLGGHVVAGEYHFPTMRGENRALVFDRLALEGVSELVDTMLDGVAAGAFVPTDRVDDCKFCDFADICRARDVGYGKTVSPLASWSEEHLNAGLWPAFAQLKRTRTFES